MSAVDNPTERAHARLSASGSKRWLTCPGSIGYGDTLPPELKRGSSKFAMEGTAAHSLGETCLRAKLRTCRTYKGWWINQEGDVTKDWRTAYKPKSRRKDPPEGWFEVNDNMMDAVDVYLDVVWAEAERLGPMAELSVERRFDLSWLRPEMFGTNDCSVSLFLDELVVIDYKHGQGVPVEASYVDASGTERGNPQLMYYGLGAAHAEDFTHAKVTLIVVQPRCPHPKGGVRRYTCDMAEMLQFRDELAMGADRVREAADMLVVAQHDPVEFDAWCEEYLRPGDHCDKTFCDRLTTCQAFRAEASKQAMADFDADPFELPVPQELEQIARLLEWGPRLDALVKTATAQAEKLMASGVEVPRHKFVRGKANRAWRVSEAELAAKAAEVGVPQSELYTQADPKLISPAQFEKKGKKAKEAVNGVADGYGGWLIEPIAAKGEGKIVIAHESDPREAVPLDAAVDFADDYQGGEE